MRQEELEAETRALFDGDGASALLGNDKLVTFLRRVVVGREIFDYTTLALSVAADDQRGQLFKSLF